jgi:hypothetical protein
MAPSDHYRLPPTARGNQGAFVHKLAGKQAQSCVIDIIALLLVLMIAGTPGRAFGDQVPPAPRGPRITS